VQFTGLCVYADTAILTKDRRSGITGLAEPREPEKALGNQIQENQIKRSKALGNQIQPPDLCGLVAPDLSGFLAPLTGPSCTSRVCRQQTILAGVKSALLCFGGKDHSAHNPRRVWIVSVGILELEPKSFLKTT